jgi:anaerobic selenocysteine-containing dehydrogenase
VFDQPNLASRARRSINMNHLGRALTDTQLEPPVKALFVWNGNPAVTVPNADLIRTGLEREDLFTVVSEQFITDTARYADVIFPATTQLEQLDVVPAWGHLYLGWNEPAIEPLGEAVPNTELWRRLADAMGLDEPELQESDESLIHSALTGVDVAELADVGFMRLDLPEDLRPYAEGGFQTEDGRARLFSKDLAAQGLDPLPQYRAPTEALLATGYPLVMLTPKHHTRFLNSSYTHLPKHGPAEGGPFVEFCAADASARGIGEGDAVRVYNQRGSLQIPAKITDRLRPGVVAVPFGWWGDASANLLTSDTLTDWGGGVAYSDTYVEAVKS